MLNLIKDYDPSSVALKMMELQKSAIDNTYDSMVALQNQAEKITISVLEQIPYLPQDSLKIIDEWSLAYKKSQDEYKKSFDDNYKKLEDFFAESKKSAAKAKVKPATNG